ncbi:26582_t:CDS:1, partial [Gigaspora margarita]
THREKIFTICLNEIREQLSEDQAIERKQTLDVIRIKEILKIQLQKGMHNYRFIK